MRATKWSGKTTVEYQDDILATGKIGKPDSFPVEIGQGKIWGRGIEFYFWHLIR
jgi:hypothetical protein